MSKKNGRGLSTAARTFHLLGNETRLHILQHLNAEGETDASALVELLGMNLPALRQHLTLLRLGHLVECRRLGQRKLYRLASQVAEDLLQLAFGA